MKTYPPPNSLCLIITNEPRFFSTWGFGIAAVVFAGARFPQHRCIAKRTVSKGKKS